MKNTIRLWHPYRADFIRRGHRKAERLTTRAPVDVELPALSSSELSFVGHVVKGSLAWARAGAGDDGDVVEYRGWNGDLFAPARGLGGQRIDPAFWSNAITADETMTAQVEHDPILEAHYDRTGDRLQNWAKTFAPEDLDGRIVADDRARCLAAAGDLSKDLLLVDGEIWRRVPDPFWCIEQPGRGQYTVHLYGPTSLSKHWGANRIAGFRADRLTEALAWIEGFGRHRNRDPMTYGPSGSVVDFDPAYLRRDDLVIDTAHIGRSVLRAFCHEMPAMTTAGVAHYAAARDVHNQLEAGRCDAEDVAAFLEAVDGMAEDIRRFDFPTDRIDARDLVLKEVDHLEWRIRRGEAPALALGLSRAAPDLGHPAPALR